ncbi:MAG TPA: DUF2461 domain-containing protein [Acidimicrobiia bacterium]|nr:DUF2461 domain-containing protein [Acidimicrobiia bacterium]
MADRHFTPALFQFLRELSDNNDKAWWDDNKDRYVTVVREPALDFIAHFADSLNAISPHFSADTRTNGGSLMRPYRDMRFAKGAPYKTNVGIHFRHRAGNDVHAPGFYVHLEPRQCFAGVGLWRPQAAVAQQIRQTIFDDPAAWGEAAHNPSFTDLWSIGDEDEDRLKRTPKELQGDHPYPDDLRLRSFTAGARLTQKTVTSPGFAQELAEMFAKAAPYTRFLCDATGVRF